MHLVYTSLQKLLRSRDLAMKIVGSRLDSISFFCRLKLLSSGTTLFLTSLSAGSAQANICGSDFQNFNPTSSGLDFVTVHSSETLRPCLVNMGLFLNHAANTLAYSQNYPGSTTNIGEKSNDRITTLDLSAGIGLTQRWDAGLSFPFTIDQQIDDPAGATSYSKKGLNEVRVNTKYRLSGNENGGLAAVLSANFNTIKNNPFAGSGAGPTTNFEFVGDTTLGKWALSANLGYRWRQPGDSIPNQPFKPLRDQYIYSLATSYHFPEYDSKAIFELVGSRAAGKVDYDTDRSLNALEWIAGVKHDVSHNLAVHFGGGTEIGNAMASPEWRLYAGLNWTLGPVCDTRRETTAQKRDDHELYTFSAEVLFAHNSDELKSGAADQIDRIIAEINKAGFKKMEIEGHTDSVGAEAYNLQLSQRRANAVKKYIVDKHKVGADKIATVGYGETRPIADNGNFQGRQKNRRVEFKVWK